MFLEEGNSFRIIKQIEISLIQFTRPYVLSTSPIYLEFPDINAVSFITSALYDPKRRSFRSPTSLQIPIKVSLNSFFLDIFRSNFFNQSE